MSPIYDFTCEKCEYTIEVLLAMNAEVPLCIHCDVPMRRGCGSLAFFRMKGELQGSTPGVRMRAEEITRKTRHQRR